MATHQPPQVWPNGDGLRDSNAGLGYYDDKQRELTNKLHDLVETASHAGYAIFVPMDGRKGVPLPTLGSAPRQVPPIIRYSQSGIRLISISVAKNTTQRLTYLTHANAIAEICQSEQSLTNTLDTTGGRLVGSARLQIEAQANNRAELRGQAQYLILHVTSTRGISPGGHEWLDRSGGCRLRPDHFRWHED
jgi:hypothetical protein